MSNRFTITESEKERILGLHEQLANPYAKGNPLSNSTLNTGTNVASTAPKTVPKIVSSTTPEEKKLMDAANSWVATNQATLPKTVAEITKFLNDKVTSKEITPESLPYIKGTIQTNSNGALVFPKEETGGQPSAPGAGVKSGIANAKVKTIQELLNSKYKAGLVADGKWGPKTALALQKAMAAKSGVVKSTPAATKAPVVNSAPVVTTESSNKKRYRNLISEQEATTPAAVTPAAVAPAATTPSTLKDIQTTLLSLGYNLGKYGADGKLGPVTLSALSQALKSTPKSGTAATTNNPAQGGTMINADVINKLMTLPGAKELLAKLTAGGIDLTKLPIDQILPQIQKLGADILTANPTLLAAIKTQLEAITKTTLPGGPVVGAPIVGAPKDGSDANALFPALA
jgi:peptidoglycan hydrolase-like protein with peptidoglycan-binding domain